jgi:hypothetical protein
MASKKENQFNKLYRIFAEDASISSNFSMQGGGAGRSAGGVGYPPGGGGIEMNPTKVSLLDIVAEYEKEKRKKNPSNPIIGYPLQNKLPEDIGEIFVKISEIASRFKVFCDNPIIKENPKALKTGKKMLKKLAHAGGAIMSLKDDLDDLIVEK